jgi:hypothetical protein
MSDGPLTDSDTVAASAQGALVGRATFPHPGSTGIGPLFDCDARGCDRPADWAYIGEAGDLYVCRFHKGAACSPHWTEIAGGGRMSSDTDPGDGYWEDDDAE